MDTGENGWMLCYGFSAGISLLTAIGIVYLRHHAHEGAEAMDSAAEGEEVPVETVKVDDKRIDYGPMPDMAWLAWVVAAGALVAVAIIRSLFPDQAVKEHEFSATAQGRILFLISFFQAITGLVLCRSRLWMYRALPVGLFGVLGVAGVLFFHSGETVPVLMVGAVLFGLFSGSFYFYFVFHAIAHPVKAARNVAINETVVGVTAILGPIMAGAIAEAYSYQSAYALAAAALGVMVVVQVSQHHKTAITNDKLRITN
jgi:hypothetical protein